MEFQSATQIKKVIAIAVATVMFSFVVFVLIRNDWAVDMNDLRGAVKKALGTRTVADQQETILAQLDVTPGEVFKKKLKDGKWVTIVTGEIQNKSRYPMEKVFVEGRLLDGTKAIRTTIGPVPCNRTMQKNKIDSLNSAELKAFYMNGDQQFNCIIKSDYVVPFMVVFDSLPDSFNSTFKFEVHPHSGQFLE